MHTDGRCATAPNAPARMLASAIATARIMPVCLEQTAAYGSWSVEHSTTIIMPRPFAGLGSIKEGIAHLTKGKSAFTATDAKLPCERHSWSHTLSYRISCCMCSPTAVSHQCELGNTLHLNRIASLHFGELNSVLVRQLVVTRASNWLSESDLRSLEIKAPLRG